MRRNILWVAGLIGIAGMGLSFQQQPQKVNRTERIFHDTVYHCYAWESYSDGKRTQYMQLADSASFSLEGMSVRFYDNGDTATIMYYRNNRSEGPYLIKNVNGWIEKTGQYKNGASVGVWKTYIQHGMLLEETIYEEGINRYITKHYGADNGQLIYTEVFDNDKCIQTEVNNQSAYDRLREALKNQTGRQIFLANCGACHNPYRDAVGPMLKGVLQRHPEKWVRSWITNAHEMIANEDKTAVSLYYKWNQTAMPSFVDLSKQEMDKLIAYLNSL